MGDQKNCVHKLVNKTGVDFIKTCFYSLKNIAHTYLGDNKISWAQGANAWCQIRVNLCK
jgi:hypothetical protein